MMNRLLWELRRAQWQLGTFGLLGALMLVAAAIIAVVEIVPLRSDIASRRHDQEMREAKLRQPPPPMPDVAQGPVSADQRYFIFLHSLHAIAAKNGLQIPQITYQIAAQDKAPIRQYLVDATFSSTYLQLRGFIAELRRQSGVRCERLTASRPTISTTQLEVHLQCAFVVEASK